MKFQTHNHNLQNIAISGPNQLNLGSRGNGVGKHGGSRVPKQPHQHFNESSKVKRTLAPSPRKPLEQ